MTTELIGQAQTIPSGRQHAPHHVPGLSLTPEQIAARRSTLGASEIPVLAGVVKWKSPIQLWQEKMGIAPPFDGNEFTEWGTILEEPIRQWYGRKRGVSIRKPAAAFVHPTESWASCSPDGLVYPTVDRNTDFDELSVDRGLEVKCRGAHRADEWGEQDTDEVPFDVAIQCQWSMWITGLARWDVATLIGGNQGRIYTLNADPIVIDGLVTIARAFWFGHVVTGTQPPIDGSQATHDFLKERYARSIANERPATVEEAEWLRQLRGIRAEKKEIETRELLTKNLLIDSMKEIEAVRATDGSWASFKAPNGTTTKWKQVAEAMNAPAAVVAKYSEPAGRRFNAYYKKEK